MSQGAGRRASIDATGLRTRAVALRVVRSWLDARGYVEVPTACIVPSAAMEPQLHPIPVAGGFLRTSPEFALKRVVAAGLPRVYELGPCFRDREHGPRHRREFWMLEWYRAGAGLVDVMDEVEALVAAVACALGVPAPSWQRTTVAEVMQANAGVHLPSASLADLGAVPGDTWDDAFFRRWVDDVEPALHGGVLIRDWPAAHAALSTVRTDRPWPVAERFEAYLHGVELANAFHELVDAHELRARFVAANVARVAAGEAENPVDEALLDAVARMPPTTGIALGVDRLVAALCGWPDVAPGRVELSAPA